MGSQKYNPYITGERGSANSVRASGDWRMGAVGGTEQGTVSGREMKEILSGLVYHILNRNKCGTLLAASILRDSWKGNTLQLV
jgi:hypothetical protein